MVLYLLLNKFMPASEVEKVKRWRCSCLVQEETTLNFIYQVQHEKEVSLEYDKVTFSISA